MKSSVSCREVIPGRGVGFWVHGQFVLDNDYLDPKPWHTDSSITKSLLKDIGELAECKACHGQLEVDCDDCFDGDEECEACDGRGVHECYDCDGTGVA